MLLESDRWRNLSQQRRDGNKLGSMVQWVSRHQIAMPPCKLYDTASQPNHCKCKRLECGAETWPASDHCGQKLDAFFAPNRMRLHNSTCVRARGARLQRARARGARVQRAIQTYSPFWATRPANRVVSRNTSQGHHNCLHPTFVDHNAAGRETSHVVN